MLGGLTLLLIGLAPFLALDYYILVIITLEVYQEVGVFYCTHTRLQTLFIFRT